MFPDGAFVKMKERGPLTEEIRIKKLTITSYYSSKFSCLVVPANE